MESDKQRKCAEDLAKDSLALIEQILIKHNMTVIDFLGEQAEKIKEPPAPTDNGIPELDSICALYNKGKIDISELVCRVWNKAIYVCEGKDVL